MQPQPHLDAARYALLRRLAPSLRHETVAHLQPITMLGGVLERRLATGAGDRGQEREAVLRLVAASRAAVHASLDLIAWLAPEAGASQPLHEAVAETVTLMRGSLAMRGFTVRDETAGCTTPVARAGLRWLLPASLLWLTDSAGPPAEVTLRAQDDGTQLTLRLDLQPTDTALAGDVQPDARALTREELLALAHAEALALVLEGDSLTIGLARA